MLEQILNNDFLVSILAFALILIPAIIIHEFGHFLAAKMVGINVLEFGVGFPPRMMRLFVWGETEFTLNWLPIGGFVRPLGEDMLGPVEDQDIYDEEGKAKHTPYITEREELMNRGVPEDKLLSVNESKPLSRIFFMAAGAIANVLSAILVFIIAALIGIPVEIGARVQVVDVPANSIFDHSEVALGDAVERVNGELFRTAQEYFVQIEALSGQTITLDMRRLEDDSAYQITATPSMSNIEPYVLITTAVEEAPGFQAGLRPGDLIMAINGERLALDNPINDILAKTQELAGTSMIVTVRRDNETLDITLVPRVDYPANEGRIGIGITAQYIGNDNVVYQHANPQIEYIPQSLDFAIQYGFGRTFETFSLIASIPQQIIDGTISPEEARPVSIVGISQIGGEFLKRSIINGTPSMILEFLALISIFLGVTNMLPFPPLDGGRIVFVIIEMVRGKPVPIQIENAIYRIGILLLLALGVFVIILDIVNPLTLVQ